MRRDFFMLFEKNHEKVSELQSFREFSKILKNHQNHEKCQKCSKRAPKWAKFDHFWHFSMIIRRCLGGFFRGGVPELQEKIMKKCRSFRASKTPQNLQNPGLGPMSANLSVRQKEHIFKKLQ
jgi:AICAR transformylase/IMP cyclohydrolase PurH